MADQTNLMHLLAEKGVARTFTRYRMKIQFREFCLGGIPKDPHVIEGWLRAKAGIDSGEELRQQMLKTLLELGAEVSADMTYEQLSEASKQVSSIKNTNGFKRDSKGLYLEDRIVKAAIKECTNILFAGERWGKTKKGPKNFTAERVFVSSVTSPEPSKLHFQREDGSFVHEPDEVVLQIIHANGPTGPVNSLSYSEAVRKAFVEFIIMSAHDEVTMDQWVEIFTLMSENGLGASRSQSYGRFDIKEWERLS